MSSISAQNFRPQYHHFPHKIVLRSGTQLHRLNIKKSHPITLEFINDDLGPIEKSVFKKTAHYLSKRVFKLKNPPVKETLKQFNLTKHLRELVVKPEDAAKYITQITKEFTRLKSLTILDEKDSFSPMRIKNRVYPMRLLQNFTYDHEFCREFMKCAIYAKSMKIRKTSLNFNCLKKFEFLENFCVILKTKYVTLPDEDKRYTHDLGNTLLQLQKLKKVVIEQEIDPENHPYLFLQLGQMLRDHVQVNLVADFMDVSTQRNESVEKILHTISNSGISNLKVNYVGIIKALKRFGRSFYAPIHVRKELYGKFIKAIMEVPFRTVQFRPTVHSSYIDSELKNVFLEFIKPNNKIRIPGISINYHLDLIEPSQFELLLDLYNYAIPSYELIITSTTNFRKGLVEVLEEHYSAVLAKVQKYKAEFSLQITARNIGTLTSLIQIITPKVKLSLLKALNIQIVEPVGKANLKSIHKLLQKSFVCNVIKKLELCISTKDAPKVEDLFEPLNMISQTSPKLKRLMLSLHSTVECREVLKETFAKLRSQQYRIDYNFEINRERANFE